MQVDEAEVRLDQQDIPTIYFTMSEASARAFADLTAENIGRRIDVRIDGVAVVSPVIREPIVGGNAAISSLPGSMDMTEVARQMVSGDVVVELEVVDE